MPDMHERNLTSENFGMIIARLACYKKLSCQTIQAPKLCLEVLFGNLYVVGARCCEHVLLERYSKLRARHRMRQHMLICVQHWKRARNSLEQYSFDLP